jgi:hypothetical protein
VSFRVVRGAGALRVADAFRAAACFAVFLAAVFFAADLLAAAFFAAK